MPPIILHIAVFAPLRKCLTYLAPAHYPPAKLIPGIRLQVPLRNKQVCGILIKLSEQTDIPLHKLKKVSLVLDEQPILSASLMHMLSWASDYYHWPIGDAFATALPTSLRQGKAAALPIITYWQITPLGQQVELKQLKRAPSQVKALELLKNQPGGLDKLALQQANIQASVINNLVTKGWIQKTTQAEPRKPAAPLNQATALSLNSEQSQAIAQLKIHLQQSKTFLLEGVTGSGKTEIYLQIIAEIIKLGQQALVLVPEINLTPQTVKRFQARFCAELVVLHSGLTDNQRLIAWLQAQTGKAQIIIGTRSAIFTPMLKPGIIIVDEEHDASFKQQDSFRYCARDLAVMRGKLENIPVILGSATPCLESLNNAFRGRYQHLNLLKRAGNALPPSFSILDLRGQKTYEGLSATLLSLMHKHLSAGNQVLIFLNRRGYAPILICHDCGWIASCKHCSAHLTLHSKFLQCHHCNAQQAIAQQCPNCSQSNLQPLGMGTQRLEKVLAAHFPKAGVLRIDKDSTRRKQAMEQILHQIHNKEKQILIGTQMLAKGHHFPNVTLVAILDTDAGLFSADFRASEHLAQLLIQVAGRAGRAEKKGEVVMQTYHPEHPLLQLLLTAGYAQFAKYILHERQSAGWPPFSYLALLRAEATQQPLIQQFMQHICNFILLEKLPLQLQGPVNAPLERKAGHYRMQLLLHASQRQVLNIALKQMISFIEQQKTANKIRWSLDIDPINLF